MKISPVRLGWAVAAAIAAPACRGGSGGAAAVPVRGAVAAAAGPAELPPGLLTRAPTGLRSVVVRDGTAYLFLELANGYDEPPTEAELADHAATLPKTLTVIDPDGLCVATVGAVEVVVTTGCDPSAMIAAPLAGCGDYLAPIGRVDDGFDPDLRWLDAPGIRTVPLFADPAGLPDPIHRRLVTEWLAQPAITAGAPQQGQTGWMSVDAGAEVLASFIAGYLVGDGEDQCEWDLGGFEEVGLRRGDQLTPLDVPAEWDSVLTWRGRIAGVFAGSPRDIRLHAVNPDGTVTVAFDQTVWSDNQECTQPAYAGIKFPCSP